ncbi:MAG: hypothetical protein OEX23_07180 [Betaproteobacteria bacterium]|nr:hypothetical protein [Betaproteobacteria bacterium]
MRKLLVVFALVLLPVAPAHAQFCPGVAPWVFADVSSSHAFCTYVTWMAQNNVTLGCRIIDPNTREYCPDDYVTRLQMAAFMNRLGNALFPLTCAAGQVMKWNGLAWTCADDSLGGGGGGGTVTSVAAGTGLTASPNPIVGAGVINLALGYQLPQSCASGQVAKSNGAGGWTCQNDNDTNSGGTVTSLAAGTGITLTPSPITATGSIAVNTAAIQARVTGTCAAGSSIRVIAVDGTVTCQADTSGPANAFVQGGNAFGALPGNTAILGTTDGNSLDIRVSDSRVVRYESNAISPNAIAGNPANSVTAGVRGATIAGGGVPAGDTDPDFAGEAPNRVTDVFGTVSGGYANQAGNAAGATIDGAFATVGGGKGNTASGSQSTIGGGDTNTASGPSSTVGGGSRTPQAASAAQLVGA